VGQGKGTHRRTSCGWAGSACRPTRRTGPRESATPAAQSRVSRSTCYNAQLRATQDGRNVLRWLIVELNAAQSRAALNAQGVASSTTQSIPMEHPHSSHSTVQLRSSMDTRSRTSISSFFSGKHDAMYSSGVWSRFSCLANHESQPCTCGQNNVHAGKMT
jgi:hypothetical protein